MKILVVDDSKIVFSTVTAFLDNSEYEINWAENGVQAAEILSQDKYYDFIFLDWNMPEMDGIDFLKLNKEKNLTSAPIVMMTTESKMEKIQQAIELGASEYVMKPFDKEVLESKIEIVLDGL
jgi:two-component system chemotaxis response regulator CheY